MFVKYHLFILFMYSLYWYHSCMHLLFLWCHWEFFVLAPEGVATMEALEHWINTERYPAFPQIWGGAINLLADTKKYLVIIVVDPEIKDKMDGNNRSVACSWAKFRYWLKFSHILVYILLMLGFRDWEVWEKIKREKKFYFTLHQGYLVCNHGRVIQVLGVILTTLCCQAVTNGHVTN